MAFLSSSNCALGAAAFLLRMWVALRLIFSGLAKFRVRGEDHAYSFDAYKELMATISESTAKNTFIPEFAANIYGTVLPWALIFVGVWTILGIGRFRALFFAGLTFLTLGLGVAALPDDDQALALGIHVAITAGALALSKYDCLSLDKLLGRNCGDCNKS